MKDLNTVHKTQEKIHKMLENAEEVSISTKYKILSTKLTFTFKFHFSILLDSLNSHLIGYCSDT